MNRTVSGRSRRQHAPAVGLLIVAAALAACSSGDGDGGTSGATGGGTTTAPPPVASVNQSPTVSGTSAKSVESEETSTSTFTVGDAETAASALTVSVASSDTTLLGADGIVVAGTGAERTLRLTPTPERSGRTTLVVTATDPQGARGTASFTLDVVAVPTSLVALTGDVFVKPGSDPAVSLSGKTFIPDSEDPATFDGLISASP